MMLLFFLCFSFIKNNPNNTFIISDTPLSYNESIMYCSEYDLKIAYVMKSQFVSFKEFVKDKMVWIIGFDSIFYNNECMYFSSNLYKSDNCSDLKFALCNNYN